MKNLTNDDLITEMQLNENTYDRNRVTKTLGSKPKQLYTKTTDKMIKEYQDEMEYNRQEGLRSDSFKALLLNKPVLTDLEPVKTEEYFNELAEKRKDLSIQRNILLKEYEDKKNELFLLESKGEDEKMDSLQEEIFKKRNILVFKKKREFINKLEEDIEEYNNRIRDINAQYENDKAEYRRYDQENKNKLAEYKQSINNTNNTYIREQTPGESDEDYQKYIQEVTKPLNPDAIKKIADYDQLKTLKINFANIFNTSSSKRLALVEDTIASLQASGDDIIYVTNTNWPKIQKKIMDTYGFDNINLNEPRKVVKIILDILNIPVIGISSAISSSSSSSRLTKEEEEEEEGKHDKKEEDDMYIGVIKIDDRKDKKDNRNLADVTTYYAIILRDRRLTGKTRDGDDKYEDIKYLGISTSGKKGTFKTVHPLYSTFKDDINIDTFEKQEDSDEIRAIEYWKLSDFNGNDQLFSNFKKKFFDNDGFAKTTSGFAKVERDQYEPYRKSHTLTYSKWKKEHTAPGKKTPSSGAPNTEARQNWKKTFVDVPAPLVGAGISIPKHDKIIKFGNVLLLYDRLIKHNMLSVKKKGGGNIENFKNVRVSDKFVDIITGAINKQNINDIYNELNEDEQQLYNILVQISGIHKYVKIPAPNVKFLKDKLKLIEGEIEAGNDNVIEELADILNKMVIVKLITKTQAIKHFYKYDTYNK